MRNYVELRKSPDWLSLSIAPNPAVDQVPSWCTATIAKTLIQIDFRLQVPWALPEPHPPITVAHLPQA